MNIALALALALGSACSSDPAHPASDASPGDGDGATVDGRGSSGRWVLGYYVGYQIDRYPIAQIEWSTMSHIAFAPMTVKADLHLDLSFDDSHGTGEADAKALSAAARANGVVPLLMLGGAGAGANINTATAPGNLAAFTSEIVATMDDLGYLGIDLDWEDSVDLDRLVALAQALRAARSSIVLTYPAGMINGNFQTVDPRMAMLGASLDQFNVQTYYPSTAVTGQGWDSWFLAPIGGGTPSTPISAEDTLARYAAIGIPKAKLGLGTGFYAICYTGGITAPHQPTTGATQIVGGDNDYPIADFFAAGGTWDTHAADRKRDDVAKQPYLSFTAPVADAKCGASTQYISYEDEQSLSDKGAWAAAEGYGGIIIWTIQEGWPRATLMQALRDAFL